MWHKKKPIHTVKYGGGFVRLWGYYSSKCPGHLIRIHGNIKSMKYQEILSQEATTWLSNLINHYRRLSAVMLAKRVCTKVLNTGVPITVILFKKVFFD